jgi:hypothetical protein
MNKLIKGFKYKQIRNNQECRKGQVAFEFLLIYSFFISVFLASLYIISQQAIQQQIYAEGMFAREFVKQFAEEINAASVIPGYEKNVTFPKTISGVPYKITIYKGIIELNYTAVTNIDILYPLSTNNVSIVRVVKIDTNSQIGELNLSKGYIVIRNENGVVEIYD